MARRSAAHLRSIAVTPFDVFSQVVATAKKAAKGAGILFEVKDRDRIAGFIPKKPDILGTVEIPVMHIISAPDKKLSSWFDVMYKNGVQSSCNFVPMSFCHV